MIRVVIKNGKIQTVKFAKVLDYPELTLEEAIRKITGAEGEINFSIDGDSIKVFAGKEDIVEIEPAELMDKSIKQVLRARKIKITKTTKINVVEKK